ncbi:hypothetical protein YSKK_12380 [Halopseudomonas aestusnigri]|jgi:hypothetical protein|nr:hypothetical protein MFKK_00960 [Halopseudomonas aestusnigri]GMQ53375.1 hypothetical protein YSKK_12380 [Halopseudomonas aestusnigri]|tara:strand:- start:310 stop:534 length:225 start_codon:yes stop_codon:yes gene_type:complete
MLKYCCIIGVWAEDSVLLFFINDSKYAAKAVSPGAMDALRAVAETPFQVGAKGITSLVAAAVLPATPAAGTRGG